MRIEDLQVLAARAVEEGRYQLLEPEGFELLRTLGIQCPSFEVVSSPEDQ